VAGADAVGACLGGSAGAVLDLEPLLPRACDVFGQVDAGDAGVVLLDVGPEQLAELVAEVLEGGVVQRRLALAQVVHEEVPDRPAGQVVPVDHLVRGPGAGGAQLAEGDGAVDDAHGPQRPVDDLHALARAPQRLVLGGVLGEQVADGDLAERPALGRDDDGGPVDRHPAGGRRQLGIGVQQPLEPGEAGRVPLGRQCPGEVVVGCAAGEQPAHGRADDIGGGSRAQRHGHAGQPVGRRPSPLGQPAAGKLAPPGRAGLVRSAGQPPLLPGRAGLVFQPVQQRAGPDAGVALACGSPARQHPGQLPLRLGARQHGPRPARGVRAGGETVTGRLPQRPAVQTSRRRRPGGRLRPGRRRHGVPAPNRISSVPGW
jgi:hypothetical protein